MRGRRPTAPAIVPVDGVQVFHQIIIGVVRRGVLEQVRAQGVRVLIAGHVDERERLGGAAQRHAKLVDGGSLLLLAVPAMPAPGGRSDRHVA